jgi:hypothetical protein
VIVAADTNPKNRHAERIKVDATIKKQRFHVAPHDFQGKSAVGSRMRVGDPGKRDANRSSTRSLGGNGWGLDSASDTTGSGEIPGEVCGVEVLSGISSEAAGLQGGEQKTASRSRGSGDDNQPVWRSTAFTSPCETTDK